MGLWPHGQMGLGKTLQAISLLSYLKIHRIAPGPFRAYPTSDFFYFLITLDFIVLLLEFWSRKLTRAVVLCPLSVTDGWLSEFSKFCPSFRVMQYVGGKLHRRDLRRTIYEDVQKASTSSRSFVCSSVTEKKFLVQYSLGVCVSHDSHQYVWHLSLLFFCPEQELPFDVLMTTYDIALMDQDFLSQIPWHYAVIDEAQRLKNPSSVSRHLIFVITWEF